ncbi:MAG: hypothetical protein AB7V26_15470 [Lysobacterales bacterium]
MNAIVIEHVPVAELPPAWRKRLAKAAGALVTVRIEEEIQAVPADAFTTDDPAFGIWRDREDLADVAAHVRRLRAPRYHRDGSPNGPR